MGKRLCDLFTAKVFLIIQNHASLLEFRLNKSLRLLKGVDFHLCFLFQCFTFLFPIFVVVHIIIGIRNCPEHTLRICLNNLPK